MGNSTSFTKDKQTKWLDLSDSKVRSFPPELQEFAPEGLNLSFNPITLPEDFGKILNRLVYLDLSNCNLCIIPKSIVNMTDLRELVLSKNSISLLPTLPDSLERLDVSNNVIALVPQQISELPNLYYVCFDGNPCEKKIKSVTLKGVLKTVTIMGKELNLKKIRFNAAELNIISELFETMTNTESGETVDVANVAISDLQFKQRLGLQDVSDPIFVDNFIRVFQQFGSKRNQTSIDIRTFLTAFGVLFKGTLNEKMRFVFDLYDRNNDGFIELDDMLDTSKSALTCAAFLSSQSENEYNHEHIQATSNEMDFNLKMSQRTLSTVRTDLNSRDAACSRVVSTQWPYVKEIVSKRFKEMDKSNKNKVNFEDFKKYWFSRYAELNQFTTFYATLLRNGRTPK